VESCGVRNLPFLYIHLSIISLKSNSMFCVLCCSSKLVLNLKPYMVTKHQYHIDKHDTQSYDIDVKLRETGG
jgi:hypothetical protein